MNQTTLDKIKNNAALIKHFDQNRDKYRHIYPLLDEGYKLSLKIMEHPVSATHKEVAADLGCHWNTIKQIRRVLNI